jgi:transcriptional regulator
MYIPPAFAEDDPEILRRIIDETRLATLVTATPEGLIATPLPLVFEAGEGGHGVLHGHVAKANPQWRLPVLGEALALFAAGRV